MTTEYQSELSLALLKARKEMGAAIKGSVNPHFKNKYAGLPEVIAAVNPALFAHDLYFLQDVQPTPNGIAATTIVVHGPTGQERRLATVAFPAMKQDAQQYSSALTYAKRASLQTAFGLPSEDDDGENARRGREAQEERANSRAQEIADAIIEKFNADDELGAYEEFSTVPATEHDLRLAVWGILKPHSPIRTALTKLGKQERDMEKMERDSTETLAPDGAGE